MIGKRIGKVKVATKEAKVKPSKRLQERLSREQAKNGAMSCLPGEESHEMLLMNPASMPAGK